MSKSRTSEQVAARGESPASTAARSGAQPLVAAQGRSWSQALPEVWTNVERTTRQTALRGVLQHGLCLGPHLEGQAPGSQVLQAQIRERLKIIQPPTPELDFISLHTDPVREYKRIHEALDDTKDNLASVARLYPGKTIGITEAGWCTNSNSRGMHAGHAVQELQAIDCADRMAWTRAEGLLCCVFEAFAENWKGSPDPWEPGKHRGRFTADRRPKLVMQAQYPDLVPQPGAHSTESTA